LTKERFRQVRVDVLEYSILRQSGNSVFGLTVRTENVAYDVCTRITRRVAVAKALADFQSEVTHQLDLQIRTPFPSWAALLNLKQCCANVRAFEIRILASSIEKQLVLDAFMQI